VSKPVYQISPFTLLDYPDKTACIVWFAGCNMRCRYCYNIDIVKGKGNMSFIDVLKFLDTRKNLLDGVVLSGGECTLHSGITSFIREIKNRDLLVKLDTNGSNPQILYKLIEEELIDYVALDFKALPDQFYFITQSELFNKFEKSLELLISSDLTFEVRTTVHAKLINSQTLRQMMSYLKKKNYHGVYYVQNFMNDTPTLENLEYDYQKLTPEDIQFGELEVIIRNY
jgi:pyruvate formate lyase activating enzyme